MKRRNLRGKRLLITGASSGIGQALTIEAAGRGAHVLATARDQRRTEQTVERARAAGGRVESELGDLREPEDRARILRAAKSYFGGLDVLVNNAGLNATGHFQYADADRLRQIMEVNFFAVCEMCRLAIPMLKSGDDPAILMIGSVVGRRALPARPEYSASKFALIGFSEALRAELAKDDVQVTVVNPGATATGIEQNMLENKAKYSPKRSMPVEQAARQTLDALERRKNEAILTLQGRLLTLANRLAPRFVNYKMSQLVRRLYAEEIKQAKDAANAGSR